MSRFRHHADLRLSEAIAIAGNEIVDSISHPAWQHSANASNAPNAAKFLQEIKYRVGPREQVLVSSSVIPHDINRIEILSICAMMLQKIFRKLALQGRETKTISRVSVEQKLVQTIAKPANTVIENKRIGHSIPQAQQRRSRIVMDRDQSSLCGFSYFAKSLSSG